MLLVVQAGLVAQVTLADLVGQLALSFQEYLQHQGHPVDQTVQAYHLVLEFLDFLDYHCRQASL